MRSCMKPNCFYNVIRKTSSRRQPETWPGKTTTIALVKKVPNVRKIAIINQKGGVGKTTTVANVGAAIACLGHDICLIDLDPQSHLTLHLGIEPDGSDHGIYDVLTDKQPISSAAMNIDEHLWLVPASIDLAAAEVELVSTVGREQILRDQLANEQLDYEFVLIDCPPSLGLLTLNALAAVDEVVIPLQPHFLALQGLGKLLETISLVQKRINPDLKVSGILMCMYESNTRLAGEVLADIEQFFEAARSSDTPWANAKIFKTMIRRNVKLAECPSHGVSIFNYEPNCPGAKDYNAVAQEFLTLNQPGSCESGTTPPEEIETPATDLPAEADVAADKPSVSPQADESASVEASPVNVAEPINAPTAEFSSDNKPPAPVAEPTKEPTAELGQ